MVASHGRRLIGRHSGLASREAVFETDEGIEVDSSDHYDVNRRRVLFTDILLVTYHRKRGGLFILLCLLGAAFPLFPVVGFLSAAPGNAELLPVIILFGTMASPALIVLAVHLIFGVDVVTVFGRRSKAELRFWFRKKRARRVYENIVAAARRAQQNLEEQIRAEAPPPPAPAEPAPPPTVTTE